MFLLNLSMPWFFAAMTLSGASANPAPEIPGVPSYIVEAAKDEVRDGTIVAVYLDPEITTSQVYRVIMESPEWDRRLTIRNDGVVLIKQRLYEPIAERAAGR